jgi:CPA2 family monovalent cation:H+ antiporter-2
MHEFPILRDLVILVAVAIPVVVAAQRFRIPTVVGFLLTGIAIGPHGLRLIARTDSVAGLAEVGVILLLFTIGLELSLSRIIRLGRSVVQGGGLQVAGTITAVAIAAALLGISLSIGILYGALVALSSTAIVLKMYTDRGELDTPHGKVVVAILLFQDLCVVPLMLLVPLLAGATSGWGAALGEVGAGVVVVGALVLGGRIVVPWVLERIATIRNREIFTLCIMFFGLGAAFVTSSFGLSLAIGAFIAGLVISESEYGMQALSDALPFRDTFSGIFFISVGMLVDIGRLLADPWRLLAVALGIVLLKAVVAAAATRSLGRSLEVSVMTGLALAQIGEFSFVLAGAAVPLGLLDPESYQTFLGASVVSMLAAPFLISAAGPIAEFACKIARRPALEILPHEAQEIAALEDHVIIVGYGLNGRNLARVLKAAGIPYVILEQNGQTVRRARLEREPIFFGDGTRPEVLERVGIARARVVVFAIAAPASETRGVAVARKLNPNVKIVVRTRYVASIPELERAGADEVVPEEFETSVEIFARVLRIYGVPSNVIQREVDAVRSEHYGVLRGATLGDLRLDALKHLGIHGALDTVEVEEGSPAVGQNPWSLELRRQTGATVIAVVRDGKALYQPDPEFRFKAGDTVVLVGSREALEKGALLFRAARGNPA